MNRKLTGAALMLALLALGNPIPALASSHSEAPGTSKDRLADDTDLYAWVAPDAKHAVTIVGNWVPMLEPNGGPNFYGFDDEAYYWINIDNVGDAKDHIRYLFRFRTERANGNTFLYNTGQVTSLADADLNVRQFCTVTRYDNGSSTVLATDVPVAPNFVGPVSMPDYGALAKAAVTKLPDGSKLFIGPRDDPFFVDLAAIFDLLTIRRVPGNKGRGVDGLGGFNVLTVAIQIPKTRLTKDGNDAGKDNSVIGIYNTVERPAVRTLNGDGTSTASGDLIQVSRLGNPLVNEVVIPLKDKDKFNATKPTGDGAFLPYVLNPELAGLFTAIYGFSTPPPDRSDLVAVFLTGIPGLNQPAGPGQVPCEMLRLNMAIAPTSNPSRLGILRGDNAGFPNGRRLFDDVVDIAERVVAGATPFTPTFDKKPNNQLGDGINVNDRPFLPYFPYVAPPHSPFNHSHHPTQYASSPQNKGGYGRYASRNTTSEASPDQPYEDAAANEEEYDEAAVDAAPGDVQLRLQGANPGTTSRLEFNLPVASRVSLKIFDLQGRTVRTLLEQDADAGPFGVQWDGRMDDGSVAGKGVYFARLVAGGTRAEKKIILQ